MKKEELRNLNYLQGDTTVPEGSVVGVLYVSVAVAEGQHCLSLSWVPRLG